MWVKSNIKPEKSGKYRTWFSKAKSEIHCFFQHSEYSGGYWTYKNSEVYPDFWEKIRGPDIFYED